MTRNCDDFEELHEANPHHPGILVIYQNDDSSKDMSRQAIIQAIANFEAVVIPLSTAFIYA